MAHIESEHLETVQSSPYASQFPEQDENGVDLSLLRVNLRLTPTERLEKHQRALKLVREVRRAGREAGLIRSPESA